jgi:hypothetical protein
MEGRVLPTLMKFLDEARVYVRSGDAAVATT